MVYSWRLSPDTKSALEHEARREGESLAALLDRIAAEWLAARRRRSGNDDAEQARLHAAAVRSIGAFGGGDPARAERARATLRQRLSGRRARA
jgi:hypothetical protein